MYIDFHTHIFPDTIAEETIRHLEKVGDIPAHSDGTAAGLCRSMEQADIGLSIVLPVATKPSQFDSINRFAAELNASQKRLLSFGGIHPDNDNVEQRLDEIVSRGLWGIKLHPDYQGVFIDDERYVRILEEAIKRDLIVVIHAGIDIGLPEPVHCTPARTAAVLDRLPINPANPRIVLAHVGGWGCWDEVETHLLGKPVYFDLGFSLGQIGDEQLMRIIRRHGADRVLFASDSPWGDQAADKAYLEHLPLTDDEREKIAFRNALTLLRDKQFIDF